MGLVARRENTRLVQPRGGAAPESRVEIAVQIPVEKMMELNRKSMKGSLRL
jgi:hypothetical protein